MRLRAVPGIPEVAAGDDLAGLLAPHAAAGLVLCIAHKVVSKAEGRVVSLSSVSPSARAVELAGAEKDPRVVEVVLEESAEVLRAERGVIISRTRHGFVCANAGVDTSNVAHADEVVLLPEDPDASARALRARLPGRPAVVITDSFGRAWRHGQVDVCIGLAGLAPLDDWRGRRDSRGMELRATWLAVADAVAAAAELVRGKDAGEPVVVVSGLDRLVTEDDGPGAAALLRPPSEDLFA